MLYCKDCTYFKAYPTVGSIPAADPRCMHPKALYKHDMIWGYPQYYSCFMMRNSPVCDTEAKLFK